MQLKRFIPPFKQLAAGLLFTLASASRVHAILAGDENALPADSPADRLDTLGAASPFNAIGSLSISAGGFSYIGSATAISPNWILTAGHNLDLNDNGTPTPGLSINFNLLGFGTYAASSFYTCPGFTGFGNPSIQNDLGLIYLANPLPAGVLYPSLNGNLSTGTEFLMAGFGRSGYGNYGYTTSATLTDRRIGYNVVNSFQTDQGGAGFNAVFLYDFSSPATTGQPGGSLGNNLESIIGPGDSGGPALVVDGNGYDIAGVNTFVEGYGGHFGDIGGGIVLAPYVSWIDSITGIEAVPEPSVFALAALGLIILFYRRRISRCIHPRRLSHALDNACPSENYSFGFSYCPGSRVANLVKSPAPPFRRSDPIGLPNLAFQTKHGYR